MARWLLISCWVVTGSAVPIVTSATSPTRTALPSSRWTSGTDRMRAMDSNSPEISTPTVAAPSRNSPAGRLESPCAIRAAAWRRLSPAASSASPSTSTWISSSGRPNVSTSSVPGRTCSRSSSVLASRVITGSGASPSPSQTSATTRVAAPMYSWLTTGCSVPAGKAARAPSTCERIRVQASSTSASDKSSRTSIVTCETPSREVELSWAISGSSSSAVSTGSVISASIRSASAPGRAVSTKP